MAWSSMGPLTPSRPALTTILRGATVNPVLWTNKQRLTRGGHAGWWQRRNCKSHCLTSELVPWGVLLLPPLGTLGGGATWPSPSPASLSECLPTVARSGVAAGHHLPGVKVRRPTGRPGGSQEVPKTCSLRHDDKSRPPLGLSPHRRPEAFAPRSVSGPLPSLAPNGSAASPKALRFPGPLFLISQADGQGSACSPSSQAPAPDLRVTVGVGGGKVGRGEHGAWNPFISVVPLAGSPERSWEHGGSDCGGSRVSSLT